MMTDKVSQAHRDARSLNITGRRNCVGAQEKIPHYYLGYWIDGSRSMQYKRNYRPHEFLRGGGWTAHDETAAGSEGGGVEFIEKKFLLAFGITAGGIGGRKV